MIRYKPFLAGLTLVASLLLWPVVARAAEQEATWYRGMFHTHTFWSDGDEFPEMVAQWYKSQGYQVLGISDHNCLARGERWQNVQDKKRAIPESVIEACRKQFGAGWVETRGAGEKREVRLKTLAEIRPRLEEPGRFLMIENEEISDNFQKEPIHVNALNLAEVIQEQKGSSILDTLRRNVGAIHEQSKRLHRPMLAQLNHPNWQRTLRAGGDPLRPRDGAARQGRDHHADRLVPASRLGNADPTAREIIQSSAIGKTVLVNFRGLEILRIKEEIK